MVVIWFLAELLLSFLGMRIALPERQGRVSPVFDSAKHLWILELGPGRQETRMSASLHSSDPLEKARQVCRFGVDILICGAITREARMVLSSSGVALFAWICGSIEEVIQAFCDGRLDDDRFKMPGGRQPAVLSGKALSLPARKNR
jgi:predicted Fe-Mo cluster-binding NifX family protein